MIGPQAYENLFLTKHPKMKEVFIEHEGQRYTYPYDWEILSMYEGMAGFRQWCIEDVEERGGMYADRIEVIE
jgi:hypothetical protein